MLRAFPFWLWFMIRQAKIVRRTIAVILIFIFSPPFSAPALSRLLVTNRNPTLRVLFGLAVETASAPRCAILKDDESDPYEGFADVG
jgi:hypothetical protein